MDEPIVIASALQRPGITEDDVLHAWRHYFDLHPVESEPHDPMYMYIGPDQDGQLLEVGLVHPDEGVSVIVHAMPCRKRFLPKKRRR